MRQPAAEGVRRFIAAALEQVGKQEALRAVATRVTGLPVATRTVSAWKTKGNTPGPTLFALARELGISLDAYAFEEGTSLAEQVERNAQDIARVVGWVTELAAREGHTDILRSDAERGAEAMTQDQDA